MLRPHHKHIMRATLLLSLTLLLTNASVYAEDDLEKRITEIELKQQEIKSASAALRAEQKNQRSTKKRINSFKRAFSKYEENLRIHGFLSAAVNAGQDDNQHLTYGFNKNANFRSESVVGTQLNYQISEKNSAVIQLVALGYQDFDLRAEWAFVKHSVNDWFSVRVGRLRLPIYIYSESVEVGFSYPFVRPPVSTYWSTITGYEGVDFLATRHINGWYSNLQLFAGTYTQKTYNYDVHGRDISGINLVSEKGPLTFRIGYSQMNFDADVDLSIYGLGIKKVEDKVKFFTMGFLYNDGNWYGVAEYAPMRSPRPSFIHDYESSYFTIGHYFGKWLPYFTFGLYYSINDSNYIGVNDLASDSITFDIAPFFTRGYALGFRREITTSIALKAEVQFYTDFAEERFVELSNGTMTNGSDLFEGDVGDSAFIYSLSLDAVF